VGAVAACAAVMAGASTGRSGGVQQQCFAAAGAVPQPVQRDRGGAVLAVAGGAGTVPDVAAARTTRGPCATAGDVEEAARTRPHPRTPPQQSGAGFGRCCISGRSGGIAPSGASVSGG